MSAEKPELPPDCGVYSARLPSNYEKPEAATDAVDCVELWETAKATNPPCATTLKYVGDKLAATIDALRKQLNELAPVADIGRSWQENSSLEKWFPYTAEELAALRREVEELKRRLKDA